MKRVGGGCVQRAVVNGCELPSGNPPKFPSEPSSEDQSLAGWRAVGARGGVGQGLMVPCLVGE